MSAAPQRHPRVDKPEPLCGARESGGGTSLTCTMGAGHGGSNHAHVTHQTIGVRTAISEIVFWPVR